MKLNLRVWHRWTSIIIALPLCLIVGTGIILLNRNNFEWIQPKSVQALPVVGGIILSHEAVLERYQREGDSIDQIIYRPEKLNLSIRYKSGHETQVHPHTGEILKSAMRRTNFLIELHQGSFFGKNTGFVLFLVIGICLFFLIISGVLIFPFKRFKR